MPRVQPQNEEAEHNVIGSCLQSPKAVEAALQILRPHHFYVQRNSNVFGAIADLAMREEPIDMLTVIRELEATHKLGAANAWDGGEAARKDRMRAHLAECIASALHAHHVARHAQIVKEMWGKRRLIEAYSPIMTGAWNGSRPDQVLRGVERASLELRGEIEDEGQSKVISSENASQWLRERVANPPDRREGVSTPFSFLPRFQKGRLYVLGGYPKDGKTAASVQFLRPAAEQGLRVGYCTVEMSWQDLATRWASTHGVPYGPLQDGIVASAHQDAFGRAMEEMEGVQVDLIDDAAITASDIARYQRVGRYDYLIIDYLQRMPYKDRFELNAQIKAITTLARTAEIPILLLSQFSRPQNVTTGTAFPRPTMSMFAETSVIEKEAAMAMAIWRPRDAEGNPGEDAKLLVMASRFTAPGAHDLFFRSQEQRFVEIIRR